jgi:hypothetical protein
MPEECLKHQTRQDKAKEHTTTAYKDTRNTSRNVRQAQNPSVGHTDVKSGKQSKYTLGSESICGEARLKTCLKCLSTGSVVYDVKLVI